MKDYTIKHGSKRQETKPLKMSAPSLLRWAGSKRKSLHHLVPYWENSRRDHYVEPFCGSAALFFAIDIENATLSDKNEWLINCLRLVCERPLEVYELSKSIPRTKDNYLSVRQSADHSPSIESAANFIYLNRNCFNGIFRTNREGHFNVPFSSRRTGEHPSIDTFIRTSKKLQKVHLTTGDFEVVVRTTARPNSFVYLDPPYATKNARIFTQYNSHSFGLQDIERMAYLLDDLEKTGSRFVVSYADVPEIQFLKDKWNCKAIEVQRHVSGFTTYRRFASEILISNF